MLVAGLVSAAVEIAGEAPQGALLQGRVDPGSRVAVDGHVVRVSPDGVFLVGIGRDESDLIQVKVIRAHGGTESQTITPIARDYKIQRIDGLPPGKVSPRGQKVLARIRRDGAEVKAARRADDPRTDFATDFQWPVIGPISGVYGSQRVLNGKPRRPHFGIDIAAPTGTPVRAPAAGVVTLAAPDMFFSGGTLILDHGHGLSSSFLHLSKLRVKKGQRVEQGDLIAEVGATGRVTGAHLDWRMNLGAKRLDPGLLPGIRGTLPTSAKK
jgi:murein DD-endopeptidase MepM/ murein hydrolase activator NlpD